MILETIGLCFSITIIMAVQPLEDGSGHSLKKLSQTTTVQPMVEEQLKLKEEKKLKESELKIKELTGKNNKSLITQNSPLNMTPSEHVDPIGWLFPYINININNTNTSQQYNTKNVRTGGVNDKKTEQESKLSGTNISSVTLENESMPKADEKKKANAVMKTKTDFTLSQPVKHTDSVKSDEKKVRETELKVKEEEAGKNDKSLITQNLPSNLTPYEPVNPIDWLFTYIGVNINNTNTSQYNTKNVGTSGINDKQSEQEYKLSETKISSVTPEPESVPKGGEEKKANAVMETKTDFTSSQTVKHTDSVKSKFSDSVVTGSGKNNQANSDLEVRESEPVSSCKSNAYGSVCTYVLVLSGTIYFQHMYQLLNEMSYFTI